MTDYSYVDGCAKRFNAALAKFYAFRDQLKQERLGENQPCWLEVINGCKPWIFEVDWIGQTYRFTMVAETQLSGGYMHLAHPRLLTHRVEWAPNEIILHEMHHGFILQELVKVEHNKNCYSPSTEATALFFELIGMPLRD